MPKKGQVRVTLTRRGAGEALKWLESWRKPQNPFSVSPDCSLQNAETQPGAPASVVHRVRRFAERKRSANHHNEDQTLLLDKEDARWLAGLARPRIGMFASRRQKLPLHVGLLCLQCEVKVFYSRVGRARLSGAALRRAIERHYQCERHLKRLRRRARMEAIASMPLLGPEKI